MSETKTESRTWLTEGREMLGLDRQAFGQIAGASEALIAWLENGATITHPHIAGRIIRAIGGTVDQYNQLVAKIHREKKLPRIVPIMSNDTCWHKKCMECGRGYIAYRKNQEFCSKTCAALARHRKLKEKGANE